MKKNLILFIFSILACTITAQDYVTDFDFFTIFDEELLSDTTVIDTIQQAPRIPIIEAMEGKVTIHQSAEIDQLILDKILGEERQIETVSGFRVQVFSDNNTKSAKSAAFELQKRLEAEELGQEIYVLYNPPFWKVRLGNFLTQEDALLLRDEIRRRFPDIQGDTYIVRDQIQIRR